MRWSEQNAHAVSVLHISVGSGNYVQQRGSVEFWKSFVLKMCLTSITPNQNQTQPPYD